jgi:hypothetical protein
MVFPGSALKRALGEIILYFSSYTLSGGESAPMHEYDRSSKWLIQHHGDAILRLAGVSDILSWRPLQAEVVQPRQLPDGLLEVKTVGVAEPNLYVLEIATYAEPRLNEQLVRDAALVYLDRRELPEVLTLILRPKGAVEISSVQVIESPRGWTRWQFQWRVVTLWTIRAEDLLNANDVGLIPWVPLTRINGPPEPVLRECRDRIDQSAAPDERENLLAVTHILAGLRYNSANLSRFFGGQRAMIESPVLQEILAQQVSKLISNILVARFGAAASDVITNVCKIEDEARLEELNTFAAVCPDLDAFRSRVQSVLESRTPPAAGR